MGQYFRKVVPAEQSLVDVYAAVSPKFVGVAATSVLVSAVMSVYYIYIMAYCLLYLLVASSHQNGFGRLPWATEDEHQMLDLTRKFYFDAILQHNAQKDELGWMNYKLLGAVAACWVIVYLCIRKGTEQTGKIAVVTVLLPYVTLAAFLIR